MTPETERAATCRGERPADVSCADSREDTQNPHIKQRRARHLHSLGARAVLEALQEIEDGATVDDVLVRYARLTPELVRGVGGDRWPAAIWLVEAA